MDQEELKWILYKMKRDAVTPSGTTDTGLYPSIYERERIKNEGTVKWKPIELPIKANVDVVVVDAEDGRCVSIYIKEQNKFKIITGIKGNAVKVIKEMKKCIDAVLIIKMEYENLLEVDDIQEIAEVVESRIREVGGGYGEVEAIGRKWALEDMSWLIGVEWMEIEAKRLIMAYDELYTIKVEELEKVREEELARELGLEEGQIYAEEFGLILEKIDKKD